MTTTLRPTAPLQQGADGAKSRQYEVCVNSRPVGTIELATDVSHGAGAGRIAALAVNETDRRRGRATVAMLAAEEVLRGWRCDRVNISVPAGAAPALRLVAALGYTERNITMGKPLPMPPPQLPEGISARAMTTSEFDTWLAHTKIAYVRGLTRRGFPEEAARAKADADHAASLADGMATPDTYLGVLTSRYTVLGTLWVALRRPFLGRSGAFVFDVEVAEAYRGRGHGRSLMLLAEQRAFAAGGERIGLNVYADNVPALRLYESLGYESEMRHFYKQLL
ncbi:GNAT family N-acetyltransferase [Streptomyces sp. 21So2-11]|uniref:GNAT family N-acetyltransferase n=1 Tax=Streptomyces sp. 21So2-11 TaxID=3144408 RepID=UPI0032194DE2